MFFAKYLIKLIKKASSALNLEISDIKCDSDSIEFVVDGVTMYGVLFKEEEGTKLRLYFVLIDRNFDMNDNEALLEAFPIINSFNLNEGGKLQLVLLPDSEEETLMPAFKAFDVYVPQDIIEDVELEEDITNLLIGILAYTEKVDYYIENYVKELENI